MVAFRPVQVTPRVAIAASTSTNSSSFDDLDPFVQSVFVVVVEHRDGLLRQDRPGVSPGVDQVHRAAGDPDPVGQRVGHRVRTGEGRQQRRMGVDDPAGEPRKKLRPKDFHEPGGHHQIGLVRGGGLGDGGVPGGAVGVVGQPHGEGRHRRGRGDLQRRGSPGRFRPRPRARGSRRRRRRAAIAAANRCPRPAPPAAPVRSGAHGAVAARREPSRWLRGGSRSRLPRSRIVVVDDIKSLDVLEVERGGRSGGGARRVVGSALRLIRRARMWLGSTGSSSQRRRSPDAVVRLVGSGVELGASIVLELGGLGSVVGRFDRRRRPSTCRHVAPSPRGLGRLAHAGTARAAMPPDIATVSAPMPTNHRKTAGPNVRLVHPDVAEVAQRAAAGEAEQRHRRRPPTPPRRPPWPARAASGSGRRAHCWPDRDRGDRRRRSAAPPTPGPAAASAPRPAPAARGCRRRTP